MSDSESQNINRNYPTSFRFENPEMQRELVAAVKRLGIGVSQQPDGTIEFKSEDWPAINREGHKLRDKRFGRWYFGWMTPRPLFEDWMSRLQAKSLPFEVEHHGSRVVLLLPESQQRQHQSAMAG